MRSTRFAAAIVICLCLLSAQTLLAQAALDCASLATRALTDFGTGCRDLANGTLCYGHASVTAPTPNSASGPFANTGDQIPLNSVDRVIGSEANLTSGEWGVALANMLPTDTSSSVQLLIMGDATFKVSPDEPSSIQIGTGFGTPICSETPSLMAIETRDGASMPIKINGAAGQISSLIVFQQESTNAIKAIVYSGSFAIDGGATAQAGQTLAGVMDNKGVVLFWSAPRPSNPDEAAAAAVAVNAFTQVGIVQPTPAPPPPTATPIPPTTAPAETLSCGDHVTHVVQPGENLFRIAMRYNTSIGAIQQANGIADPNQIVVGQSLVIPCGVDSGTSSVAPGSDAEPTAAPGEPTAAPAVPTTQTIDCSGFNGQLPPNAPPAFKELFNRYCNH